MTSLNVQVRGARTGFPADSNITNRCTTLLSTHSIEREAHVSFSTGGAWRVESMSRRSVIWRVRARTSAFAYEVLSHVSNSSSISTVRPLPVTNWTGGDRRPRIASAAKLVSLLTVYSSGVD